MDEAFEPADSNDADRAVGRGGGPRRREGCPPREVSDPPTRRGMAQVLPLRASRALVLDTDLFLFVNLRGRWAQTSVLGRSGEIA